MTATTPVRRKKTAKALAEQFGVSERTIRRHLAEPRGEYEARANERRQLIADKRAQGMTMRAIAAELGVSLGLVATYAKEADQAPQLGELNPDVLPGQTSIDDMGVE